MAAQNFKDWWNEHRASMLEWDWDCVAEAAWNAAEEKFNSALRQPTNQGREPSEIAPPVTCECCHEQPAVMNVCHDCYMAT
jgi:hypothetical protein